MILTVTPNTCIDHVLFVPHFGMNMTIRATQSLESIAGKPTDVSWIMGELGLPTLALGFRAGPTGQLIESMLHEKGVTTDFTLASGDSRRNIVIIAEDESGQSTITSSSLRVSTDDIAALVARYEKALSDATVVVMGGTLPEGAPPALYTDLIKMARDAGLPVIFDASEPYLTAGLAAGPTFVKPNRDELTRHLGREITSTALTYEAGLQLRDQYGTQPIISLGDEGGLAVLADRAFHIPSLPVRVVNTAGAGDAILAGLAASIHLGQSIEDGLRLGFGAAAAVVTMPGTAECRKDEVEHFASRVELIPYPPVESE